MINFKLLETIVLSKIERKARKIDFHEKMTVLTGTNRTGKSSMIKSIFYGFGADSYFDDKWEAAKCIVVNKFKINEYEYTIYRDKGHFKIFNKEFELLFETFERKELSKYFSKIFKFELLLEAKKQELTMEQSYPNQMLLPFYLDQDRGWIKILNSFLGEFQFKNANQGIIEYYLGILNPKKYEYNELITKTEKEKIPLEKEKENCITLINLSNDILNSDVELDIESHKTSIEILSEKIWGIKKKLEIHREEALENFKVLKEIMEQKKVLQKQLKQMNKDYEYASSLKENIIECPLCGTGHENSFIQKLELANDTEEVLNLIKDLNQKEKVEEKNQNKLNDKLEELREELSELETRKKEEVEEYTLNDILALEGKKYINSKIFAQVENLKKNIKEVDSKIENLESEKKQIEKLEREKRKKIKEKYLRYLKSNLLSLKIVNFPEEKYKRSFTPVIKETGSDLSRSILAYSTTINEIILEEGKFKFPFIIDSPKQQEQDLDNEIVIIDFIKNKLCATQKILGTVDYKSEDVEEKIIKFDKKYNVLKDDEYKLNIDFIRKLEEIMQKN